MTCYEVLAQVLDLFRGPWRGMRGRLRRGSRVRVAGRHREKRRLRFLTRAGAYGPVEREASPVAKGPGVF